MTGVHRPAAALLAEMQHVVGMLRKLRDGVQVFEVHPGEMWPEVGVFAVYLLSDPNGPPTACLLFRSQCIVSVLVGTHWVPSDAQARWHRGQSANPFLLHCCTAAALLSLC